jgi:C1q domain
MSNRLAGVSPLNYQGTQASNPPNITYHRRAPLPTDWQNFSIGDFWIYSATQQIWVLLSLANNVADWVALNSEVSAIETLTGNTGGAVSPAANNINVVGDGTTVNVVGNPATHTLTVSAIGSGVVSSLTGNSGGAVFPFDNNTNLVGSGSITVVGNPGTSTLTITPSGAIADSFITSPTTGTATPASGVITFAGTGGTTVSASGSTITINSTGGSGGTPVSFNAYLSTTQTDVTGDGTVYQPIFDAVLFNNDSGYNASTGVFTAPLTGDYLLGVELQLNNGAAAGTLFNIVTTSHTYAMGNTFYAAGPNVSDGSSVIASMSAGDTAYVTLALTNSGGGKTISVNGGSSPIVSYFNGALLAGASSSNPPAASASFNAYLSTTQSNVTGDGTVYQPIFNTTLFNRGTVYNTSTGVFTAPATGIYQFQTAVNTTSQGGGAGFPNNTGLLVTTSNSYVIPESSATNGTNLFFTGSVTVPMSSGDTAYITVSILGGTPSKTIGVVGSTSNFVTYFSGFQVA